MSDDQNEPQITPAALAAFAGFLKTGNQEHFENAMTAATPGGIEQQEKQGQQDLVRSTNLPSDVQEPYRHNPNKLTGQEILEAWGIELSEDVDNLFREVTLPEGWRKDATGHSMWSELLDDKGRKRAGIFYKAAFYDRRAFLRIESRFYATTNSTAFYDDGVIIGQVVTSDGDVLFETEPVDKPGTDEERDWQEEDRLKNEATQKAKDWLDETYPNWQDPIKAWEYEF